MLNQYNKNLIEYPRKLPGSFWGLTTFFNPNNYNNKINNYNIFRENIIKQGIKLITVECAFKDKPFQLTAKDADILIQVRSNSILWHKENLLNIAFSNLPVDCDKIAWMDCDIIFLNKNWVKETASLLEKYVIVKPFKQAIRISEEDSNKIIKTRKIEVIKKINNFHNNDLDFRTNDDFINYISVFSWAARRSIFDEIGFYDKMVVGGGDSIMTTAFMGQKIIIQDLPMELEKDIKVWSTILYSRVKGSIFFLNGKVIHMFHGSLKNRKYDSRYNILKKNDFDPIKDVGLNKDGCLEWISPKKELHKYLHNYFYRRNEKNSRVLNIFLFIKYKEERAIYLDEMIGKIGIFIKNFSPQIYFYLKRMLKLK
jgi:hypothetical protein